MTDRSDRLRQAAHDAALDRALRFATARKTTGNVLFPTTGKVAPRIAGETICPACGTRSSIGCKHTRRA